MTTITPVLGGLAAAHPFGSQKHGPSWVEDVAIYDAVVVVARVSADEKYPPEE